MRDTVRLGRIAGVPIGLNWSLLAIVVVFAAGLAQNRFPYDAPGHGRSVYVAAGAVSALALLGAVLLHELGHAVTARRAGLEVEGITLSWMGGVTRIAGDTRSPLRELAVAGSGPAVSVVLGVGFWGAQVAARHAGVDSLVVAGLGWLAIINVVLAAFNLLPAAPLDGGRILHAAIWAITRDRWRATRATSFAGMGLAGLVLALGAFQILAGRDELDGVLIAVLGWWILSAARDEERQAVVSRALDGIAVHDVMRPVAAAPGWLEAPDFAARYADAAPSTVWLLERWGGGYSGVVTGEVLRAVPVAPWAPVRAVDVAVPVAALGRTDPWEDLLDALTRTGGRQVLLAVEDGRTVGAVLPSDVEALVRRGRHRPRVEVGVPG